MLLPTTLVTAAALAMINIWLSSRCGRVRMKEKISIGDGGNEVLAARMRAQSNFVENAPLVLILIGLVEVAAGRDAHPWLYVIAALFVAARIAHPLGMERGAPNVLRATGAIITMLTTLTLAIWALALAL